MDTTAPITGWKEGRFLHWSRNCRTISYDMKDKCFVRQLKNKEFRTLSHASIGTFFRGLSFGEISENFQDEIYRPLIKFAYRERNRFTNMGSILKGLDSIQHYESYLLLGIRVDHGLGYWRKPFKKPVSQFSKPVIKFMVESRIEFSTNEWEERWNDDEQTKKLINDLCVYVLANFTNELEVYRLLNSLVKHNMWEFNNLIREYNCEYKTLFKYCVKMFQTETLDIGNTLTLYKDYLKMMKDMKNPRITKYTSNLRLRHDLTVRNHKSWKTEYNNELFAEKINLDYEWKSKDYVILSPRTPEDVKNEGTQQHHCVGSYVDKILDGTTQILFMRTKADTDTSLITIEVRNNTICQTKGENNRELQTQEKDWLKKYAKAKNLTYKDIRRDENLPTPTPNKETKDETNRTEQLLSV
jgi:hypothetical protein